MKYFYTLWPWDTKRLTWTNKRCVGILQVMKLWSRWQMIFSSFAAICSHKKIIFDQQWHTTLTGSKKHQLKYPHVFYSVTYLIYFGSMLFLLCINNTDALQFSPQHPLQRTCTCNHTPQPTGHLYAAVSVGSPAAPEECICFLSVWRGHQSLTEDLALHSIPLTLQTERSVTPAKAKIIKELISVEQIIIYSKLQIIGTSKRETTL